MEEKKKMGLQSFQDAEELLSAEMEEIEGGAEASCTSCKFCCYSEVV